LTVLDRALTELSVLNVRRHCSVRALAEWIREVDPGAERRVKGLRLAVVYAIAIALGGLWDVWNFTSSGIRMAQLAGGFALWASVSEVRSERFAASRDLVILCAAATVGAVSYALLSPLLRQQGWISGESVLVTGAFLVAYLKCFGTLGGGIGSQVYIGQLLAFGFDAGPGDIGSIGAAGLIAILSSVLPRWVVHRARRARATEPGASAPPPPGHDTALLNGIQATVAAVAVVALNNIFVLTESAWAITACVYVITASPQETMERARRRIAGTLVGVPLGLACMPLAVHAPVLTWILAGAAIILYAVALPSRYDIASGAFAFTLIVTLEISGQHSASVLLSRVWETMLGATLGVAMALLVWWLAARRDNPAVMRTR
jgi:fusaric acid resistance family protein